MRHLMRVTLALVLLAAAVAVIGPQSASAKHCNAKGCPGGGTENVIMFPLVRDIDPGSGVDISAPGIVIDVTGAGIVIDITGAGILIDITGAGVAPTITRPSIVIDVTGAG